MANIGSGTRVRILADDHDYAGQCGTIYGRSWTADNQQIVYIVLDDGTQCWACADDVEVANDIT